MLVPAIPPSITSQPADQVVDVTDTIERKMAALRQHRSQYDDWDKLDERVRGFLRAGARDHGLDDGRMAELFQVIKTN